MYQDIQKSTCMQMYFAHAIGPDMSRARSPAVSLKTRLKPEIILDIRLRAVSLLLENL